MLLLNAGVYYHFETLLLVLWGMYPEVAFLDYMIILYFNFLRNDYTVYYLNCTILYFHQQYTRFLFIHIPAKLIFYFLVVAILIGLK